MLGAIFGFLLPELFQTLGLRPPAFAQAALMETASLISSSAHIRCDRPRVIDGDTMDCGGTRIRLASIDAPEMPGHCRTGRDCTPGDPYATRNYLSFLTRGAVECRPVDTDVYGRTVARCSAGGRDLSCAMVAADRAVNRYGWLWC